MDKLNFNDILNRNEIVEQITQILESFRKNKKDLLQKRGIYIYGEPGSGKTTFILNLLKSCPVWLRLRFRIYCIR